MRIEIKADSLPFHLAEFREKFRPLAEELELDWKITDSAVKKRVVVLVSKQEHCLYDLLARWQSKLATNHPELNWMNLLGPKNSEQGDNHMAELALGFRVKETVLVETEEKTGRTATVQVHYDDP